MARARHVVILVENLPVPLDRRVWGEATALRDAGWRVTVIGPRGGGTSRSMKTVLDGITVLRYPVFRARRALGYAVEYPVAMAFTLAWLAWTRLQGPIDVLHGCNPPDLFWIFGWAIRAGGGAYVFDQHEPMPELLETKFGHSLLMSSLRSLLLALERASYRNADEVFTVNESMRQLVLRRGRVRPDRATVLWNAPDVASHRLAAEGILPEGRRVGYVGVMNNQEGLDLLLAAWRLVTREPDLADARLELIGDGEARPQLERLTAELGVLDSVTFHGFLPPSAYVPILAACRFGVSPDPPTAFNQLATMVKVLDYMTIGRGTVSFDLAETVRLAGAGVRIVRPPTAEALATEIIGLLRGPAESESLGGAGAARIDELRLDWAESARKLVQRYSNIASRRASTGGRPMPR